MRRLLLRVATLSLCGGLAAAADRSEDRSQVTTIAEQTDFKRTGRYDETMRLCAAFQRAWPKQARCHQFGKTPEGRPMLALVASKDGMFEASTVRAHNRPVLLLQGGIHAGEIDGKDAGFMALRDMLEGKVAQDVLDRVTIVFVPVFNVDGHERFGPNNRPNQIGPEEMGWRTTAQNFNLNRDYVKAEAPEMQAMLRLLNEWDPLVYADLHVTDGAEFEHDISFSIAPTLAGATDLKRAGLALRDALMRELKTKGSLPVDFYPSFIVNDDPSSGFAATVSPARFSHEYWARRNRIGVLVETHSWKNYKTRVHATYHSIVAMTNELAARGADWRKAAADLDRRARQLGGQEIALAYANTNRFTTIEFRGYRYTREISPISGALMTRYDNTRPEIWRVPLYDEVRASIVATAPRGGYIVPAAWAELVAAKLALHAVEFTRTDAERRLAVETFRATAAQQASTSNEGRTPLTVHGEWRSDTQTVAAGSLFVPMAQTNAQLAVILLEPNSPDSLLAWGFFNAAFERKEYMEAYVAEQVARAMLSADPALNQEFKRKLEQEPAFASSPQARLDFFYRRHPSWDIRFNLYPVCRSNSL